MMNLTKIHWMVAAGGNIKAIREVDGYDNEDDDDNSQRSIWFLSILCGVVIAGGKWYIVHT